MGRWAQQRRRGGGGTPPAAAVPANINGVTADGSQFVNITFDRIITVVGGVGAGEFQVGGFNGVPFSNQTGQSIVMDMGASCNPGDSWDLFSQPSWSTDPIVNPQSGFCV